MFTSIISGIKRITVGNASEETEIYQDYDLDSDTPANPGNGDDGGEFQTNGITIPRMNAVSTFKPAVESLEVDGNAVANKEKRSTLGTITAFDRSVNKGVIDRQYQFDITKFCNEDVAFEKGCQVEFEAEKTKNSMMWTVTSLKLYKVNQIAPTKSRVVLLNCKVVSVHPDHFEVDTGIGKSPSRTIRLLRTAIPMDCAIKWIPGDWMKITLEDLGDTQNSEDSESFYSDVLTKTKVHLVVPLNKKDFTGKVTKSHNQYLIDDTIYFTTDVCKQKRIFAEGSPVQGIAIQSTQNIGANRVVSWRATEVWKLAPFAHIDKSANAEVETNWSESKTPNQIQELTEGKDILSNKFGVKIEPRYLRFSSLIMNTSAEKTINISNTSEASVVLKHVFFSQELNQFRFKQCELDNIGLKPLLPNEAITLTVICCPTEIGKLAQVCIFDFGNFQIGRTFEVIGKAEEEADLRKDNTGNRPRYVKQVGDKDIETIRLNQERTRIRGVQTIRSPFFSQFRMGQYKVPEPMWNILREQNEDQLKLLYPNALTPLLYNNYKNKFDVSLWFEEMENDLRRRQYDAKNTVLQKIGQQFKCQIPGLQDIYPALNINDHVNVYDAENKNAFKYDGTITQMKDDELTCVFGPVFSELYTGWPVTVEFCLGRSTFKRSHFAVEMAVKYLGQDFLFPSEDFVVHPERIKIYEDDDDKIEEEVRKVASLDTRQKEQIVSQPAQSIFNKPKPVEVGNRSEDSRHEIVGRRSQSLKSRFVSDTPSQPSCTTAKLTWFKSNLNDEQKQAVRNILRGQARPLPYIIYGPPGTGKTVTLVEAIMQVNELDKNSRILVCAPSNSAADVIAEYLAISNRYMPGDFVRLNGFLRAGQTMLESIGPFCSDGENLGHIAMNRLIISTCTTAGQFFSLDLNVGHFTHVFIDEAGYCSEPEAMVPTILLALGKGAQLILAGDPNQLGPVLMSDVAQNCGLNRSFLERLMLRNLYLRDEKRFPDTKYNPMVLTKLVKNYRAHAALLKLPSKLFYDDDLVPRASYEEAYALCEDAKLKELLPQEGVPLIFHGVKGSCTRENDSPSWCNVPEAVQVMRYVLALLTTCDLKIEDIGVISPYRKQAEKIRYALEMNLLHLKEYPKVGSVEEFQGGEKKVIIISTVRSMTKEKADRFLERMNFLYQPKRFNVAITRAKALMIVIGNPDVLVKSSYWKQLLNYAIELNAYKGCDLPIQLDKKYKEILQNKKQQQAPGENAKQKTDIDMEGID